MKQQLIALDVGTILTRDDKEFDGYKKVYDKCLGYYDHDISAFAYQDLDKAIAIATTFLTETDGMNYAIISNQGIFNVESDLDKFLEQFTFAVEDIIVYLIKVKDKIIKLVDKTQNLNALKVVLNPQECVDCYGPTEILTIPNTTSRGGLLRILVGEDEDNGYYIGAEDDRDLDEVYPKDDETLLEVLLRVLSENLTKERNET